MYKFTIEGANVRKVDGVDDSVVIIVKCENDVTKSAVDANIEVKKVEFAKWPPVQADIEAKAKAYLNGKNGAVTFADEMKDRVKTISDSPIAITPKELTLAKEVGIK